MKPEVQCLLEYYTGEKFLSDAENLERSSESEEYFYASYKHEHLFVPECDFLAMPLHGAAPVQRPVAQAQALGIYGQLNAQQRQCIRDVSRNLRSIADSLHIRPAAHVAAKQVDIQNENLDESEMQVINNIYSIRSVTTVSKIANYLEEKLTPRTLRAAFHFLCYCVSSVPEELAVVCELSKLTAPKIQQLACSDSTIYDVISEFIEERLPRMY